MSGAAVVLRERADVALRSGPDFLHASELRLILFGGKGGVGKTTCAVATALRLAHLDANRRLVLVSTDPAHSLVDSLGGLPPPPNLEVVELDAEEHMAAFRRANGPKLRELASRGTFLDEEDIRSLLDLSLPGMDELIAFLEIARRVETSPEDRIVVDTAPTGHTLRLVGMPELLTRWIDALDSLLAKHRYMSQVFRGAYEPDDLDRFIDELRGTVSSTNGLLTDPVRCRFVLTLLAEELSVRESERLLDELDRLGIAANEVVVNRLATRSGCPVCDAMAAEQQRALARLPAHLASRSFWGVPWYPEEVRGANGLGTFWDEARVLDPKAEPAPPAGIAAPAQPHVEGRAPLPPVGLQMLFFAGKGGVGKTTLACATALHLARARPQQRTLLVSTDPAHSIGDCLDAWVGAAPKTVVPGLTAFEIDARAELEALKRQYATELDEFLSSALRSLDLVFDRQVMERLLDLSPPGLDEIMALTRAMAVMSEQEVDLFILDTAPTGHLVRLLEMPELVDRWLKAFFELFLKYRSVLGIPRVAKRLVAISKELRRFRKLLADPASAALYVVTIPTSMALAETEDLLASCRRLGVDAPLLFVNMVTPASACASCSARRREEEHVRGRLCEMLPDVRQIAVGRQGEPRGLERLTELGAALYAEGE
jgi:arsenite-transporting ATPase